MIHEKVKRHFRFRNYLLVGGTLFVILYLWYTDPNNGNLLAPFIGQLATPIIAVWFAHLARKALFDYLDLGVLARKAKETATGAGLAFIGVCLVIYGLLSLFGSQVYAQDVNSYIPVQASNHISTLVEEQNTHWPDHPKLGPLLH